jgi:hypothetical protein
LTPTTDIVGCRTDVREGPAGEVAALVYNDAECLLVQLGAEQMKSLKCRSLLIALVSLLRISGCMADEAVVVLNSATAGHDKRTGKPVLNLTFAETSKERLRIVSAENLGKRVEFRVDGRVVVSSVVREPIEFGHIQINDPSWTDQVVIELARQFSEAPKGEIELRPSPPSN